MTNTNKTTKKSRYQSLIVFITLFVMIIVGVLTLNFYFSSQFSENATEINLAGRQRMLSQRMAKSIQKLIQSQSINQGVDEAFEELKIVFELFDKTLNAFTNGGKTIDAEGNEIELKSAIIKTAINSLTDANLIWKDYGATIKQLINGDISSINSLSQAVEYAKNTNQQILSQMDQLTQLLQNSKYDGVYINLAGRQRMLSQRITKNLFELVNAQYSNSDTKIIFKKLEVDVRAFSLTLNLFLNGGEIQGNDEIVIQLNKVKNSDAINIINQSLKLWDPLSESIIQLLNGNTEIFSTIANANNYANTYNIQLLTLMNDLTIALDKDSTNRSNLLRYIQLIGIALALIMFGFIMLFFLKHLKTADKELDQAKEETDRILETVNDGLFLINKEHIIGEQHSDSLLEVMNMDEPAGKNFLTVLRKIVPENILKTAKEYLDLLYGDRVNAELVKDLNPLDEVEVYFDQDGSNQNVKYLGFEFNRVIKNNETSHLLVQVEDITKNVKLEKQLAESKTEAQAQFNLMIQVLHVQPEMLGQFLSDTEKSLNRINKVLQEKKMSRDSYHDKLTSIARYMHRIKGDASGLELDGFEQIAHEFEDLFEDMKEQPDLSGKDFLPLVIKLDEFMTQIESLRELISKLSELKSSIHPGEFNDSNETKKHIDPKISNNLHSLTDSVAVKQNKKVILNIFNEHLLPNNFAKPVKDILTQLIRNSIVHGIESPDLRPNFNKAEEGLIKIKFSIDLNNNLIIDYTDDGRGLIREEIIESAVNKGLIKKKDSVFLNRSKIYSLIFHLGFSIKNDVDKDAGRGIGMDVIANLVKKLNGKLGIKSLEHKYFRLKIKFPL